MFKKHHSFEYTLRKSSRAKNIGFRISVDKGLVVTVPLKFRGNIDKIIAEKSSWIEVNLVKVAEQIKSHKLDEEMTLPSELILLAIEKIFSVEYIKTDSVGVKIKSNNDVITLVGDVDNHQQCFSMLNKWVQKQARLELPKWFKNCNQHWGFNYNKVQIRGQKSRWGSCSSDKNISLNRKLLFIPPDLVEHIFLHELCHTEELNHSKDFWDLMYKFDKLYKVKSNLVKSGAWNKYIPRWADL